MVVAAGKRVHKKWKTPGTLGTFYREYVGRAIVNYHSALVDALTLHDIELHCAELKEKREKWRQTKHLAKPIQEIATRVGDKLNESGLDGRDINSKCDGLRGFSPIGAAVDLLKFIGHVGWFIHIRRSSWLTYSYSSVMLVDLFIFIGHVG